MLHLASILAKYAHDSARTLQEAAVFSTISTIVNGAITVNGIYATLESARIAQDEIQRTMGHTQKNKRAA